MVVCVDKAKPDFAIRGIDGRLKRNWSFIGFIRAIDLSAVIEDRHHFPQIEISLGSFYN
ncbi:hypothetical protein ACFLUL_03110 [Chloroflexota bacterium]